MPRHIMALIVALVVMAVTSLQAEAVTSSSAGSGTQHYLFIENNVDNEFYISPASLEPRLSGANIWTKYSTNQSSLGYIGNLSTGSNYYLDAWLEDSPIDMPFLGIRCQNSASSCPSQGYLAAQYTDNQGYYHTKAGNTVARGNSAYSTLSDSAYEYFRNRAVGSSTRMVYHWCWTRTNYDYAAGQRCKDLSSGATWRYYTYTIKKVSHLTLNSTNALSELWIASDGTPSIKVGSDYCYITNVSGTSGVMCKMVNYSMRETTVLTAALRFGMVIDTKILGFTPSYGDVKFSANGSEWYNYNQRTTYNNIFTQGGKYVYVFMSNSFFKRMLNTGASIDSNNPPFTFNFQNANTPQSGYYQFTASSTLVVKPKEYGISIISSEGSQFPSGSGKIGDSSPIEIGYTVTTSAPRQADLVTAHVTGNSVILDGMHYCLFASSDNSIKVPIPAYLAYTSPSGGTVRSNNSCDQDPINLKEALWEETPWNSSVDEGSFYTMHLKLLFPMNNIRSLTTVEGRDWMGEVSASGEVRVSATWQGVDP